MDLCLEFSHAVTPRSVIPGETFVVYVHNEATHPPSTQLISVNLRHQTGLTLADGGTRSIKSGIN